MEAEPLSSFPWPLIIFLPGLKTSPSLPPSLPQALDIIIETVLWCPVILLFQWVPLTSLLMKSSSLHPSPCARGQTYLFLLSFLSSPIFSAIVFVVSLCVPLEYVVGWEGWRNECMESRGLCLILMSLCHPLSLARVLKTSVDKFSESFFAWSLSRPVTCLQLVSYLLSYLPYNGVRGFAPACSPSKSSR